MPFLWRYRLKRPWYTIQTGERKVICDFSERKQSSHVCSRIDKTGIYQYEIRLDILPKRLNTGSPCGVAFLNKPGRYGSVMLITG